MKIGIVGCNGRMGQVLVRQLLSHPELKLGGGSVRKGSALAGKDIAQLTNTRALGIPMTDDAAVLCQGVDALIDFTSPESTAALAPVAASCGVALVIGTTGLNAEQQSAIDEAAKKVPVLQAANMSIGVNLLLGLVEQAARALDPSYDIEILEMHHRHKVDAPSGTALALGRAAADGRDVSLKKVAVKTRDGQVGPRHVGEIGFATLRGGDVVGDHRVIFAAEGERLELAHLASSRDIFAAGALRAAAWLIGKQPGAYTMKDVLGL